METYSAKNIAMALGKTYKSKDGFVCCCPAHDDQNPSLSITDAANGKILVHCYANCTQEEVINKLVELDLWPATNSIESIYNYVDGNEKLLYQVIRKDDKKFLQRRPDGNCGWIWNLDGVERVPYSLPELLGAIKAGQTIFIAEGEKDCDNLHSLGLIATTNSGGAGKWQDDFSKYFEGVKEVFIFPDNDQAGFAHAHAVVASLSKLKPLIKIVSLPGLSIKGDVSDWLAIGGTKEQLLQLCADAPEWTCENILVEKKFADELTNPRLDDIGNAERFRKMYGTEVLWVPALGKWLIWSDKNWVIDELETVFDHAKKVARSIFDEVNYD